MLLRVLLAIVALLMAYRSWATSRQDPDDNVSPIFAVALAVGAVSLFML